MRLKPRNSAREFMKRAILVALTDGPATRSEIESRAGLSYPSNDIVRVLERKGLIERSGFRRSQLGGPRNTIWRLVSAP